MDARSISSASPIGTDRSPVANPFFGVFHSIGQSRMLAYSNGFSNEGQSGKLKGTKKENFRFTS